VVKWTRRVSWEMDTGRSGRWRSVLLSRHGLRKGDGLSFVFSFLFFFEFSVVKATLKSPPPGF
jgi:hypothetical protein